MLHMQIAKRYVSEFKEFAVKGNAVELAVGIVIGAAFNKIVNSLVNDILMPPIGMLLGKADFPNLFINLSGQPVDTLAEAKALGIPTINYGMFFQETINFLIIAFTLFVVVKAINKLRRQQERDEAKKNGKR